MAFPVDSLVAVTTWRRLYRRFRRFLRAVDADRQQLSGSGNNSGRGLERETLLYSLLDMQGPGGDQSFCDYLSASILLCFCRPRDMSRSDPSESAISSAANSPVRTSIHSNNQGLGSEYRYSDISPYETDTVDRLSGHMQQEFGGSTGIV